MSQYAYVALGKRVQNVDGTDVQLTQMMRHDPQIPQTELALVRRELTRLNEQIRHTPGMKWCCNCGQTQRINTDPAKSDFSPKADNADGYHSYCKDCRRRQERLRYQERRHERQRQRAQSLTRNV